MLPVVGLGGHRREEGAAGEQCQPGKEVEQKLKARLDRAKD